MLKKWTYEGASKSSDGVCKVCNVYKYRGKGVLKAVSGYAKYSKYARMRGEAMKDMTGCVRVCKYEVEM